MERWKECVDGFMCGLVVGLGLCILISITVITVDLFYYQKEQEQVDASYQQSIEERRLELEGWAD